MRGIARMIDEDKYDKYCINVFTQISSVSTALRSVALNLLDEHLEHRVGCAVAKEAVRPRVIWPKPRPPSHALLVPDLCLRQGPARSCPAMSLTKSISLAKSAAHVDSYRYYRRYC